MLIRIQAAHTLSLSGGVPTAAAVNIIIFKEDITMDFTYSSHL